PRQPHQPHRRRRPAADDRGRHPHRRDDPEDHGLLPRRHQRGRLGPPPRRPAAPRGAPRALQRRGGRHDDHPRGSAVSALMPTYPAPAVTFVRGEGSWLWDDEGRRYLALLSGLAVTSLGHSHPAVADALAEQARTLL